MKAFSIFAGRSVRWLKLAILLPLLVSCENDLPGNDTGEATGDIRMGFNIRISDNRSASRSANDEPVGGTGLENEIDIANRDFRVYFFKADDSKAYIGQLKVVSVADVTDDDEGGYNNDYYVVGQVDKSLVESLNKGFRMVVMANWTGWGLVYPDSPQFDDTYSYDYCTEESEHEGYIVSKEKLIPMWGCRTYTNPELEINETRNLADPIHMLRTLAKMEVVWKYDGCTELSGAKISKHREKARIEVEANDDGTTEVDFDDPILGEGELKDIPLTFSPGTKDDKEHKYIVYLPEMSADDKPDITVTFKWMDKNNTKVTREWTFPAEKEPILRNHIYRYTIKGINVAPNIYYQVMQWDEHNIDIEFN